MEYADAVAEEKERQKKRPKPPQYKSKRRR